jgi:hypothetical protein
LLRKLLIMTAIVSVLLVGAVGMAFAANPPGPPGPPGQTCGKGAATSTPGGGNSAGSPGSPFVGGVSDGKYNAAKSQYDVACFQVSQPHP